MAIANSTTTRRDFERGSVLAIAKHSTNGTTNTTWVYALKIVVPGTLKWTKGGYKVLPYTDRGIQQHPYEGDEQYTELSGTFGYTGVGAVADIYAYLDSGGGLTTGLVQMFTIGLWHPTAKNQANGELIVFNKVWFPEKSIKYAAGVEYDTLEIAGMDMEVKPTITASTTAPA